MRIEIIMAVAEEINEKSFWQDPLGWISRGVAEGISHYVSNLLGNLCNNVLNFLESTSDTFTLFAVTVLILAQVLGVDTAKRYRGIIIVMWIVTQAVIALRYR